MAVSAVFVSLSTQNWHKTTGSLTAITVVTARLVIAPQGSGAPIRRILASTNIMKGNKMSRRRRHKNFILEENCYKADGVWQCRIIVTDTVTGESKPVAGPFKPCRSEEEAKERFPFLVQWWIDYGCRLGL
ncbi:MAG: hypothetical protein LBE75_05295 [Burkholderiales bacterium]|jgi:hypothetical protein|nr:hypothetical protein [Burkholderiales bacterium]